MCVSVGLLCEITHLQLCGRTTYCSAQWYRYILQCAVVLVYTAVRSGIGIYCSAQWYWYTLYCAVVLVRTVVRSGIGTYCTAQ